MNTDMLIRGTRRTVLIVEDGAVNRELLGFILSESYDVLYAENGRQAIDLIHSFDGHISMVLLDIIMPVMDGIEYLKARARDELLNSIPVIVLTMDKDSELETLKLGALDFIMKPYDMPEIILARVHRIIEFVEDRQIIRDVEHDALTGLYNRHFFHEYSRRLLSSHRDVVCDLVAVDVDHFRLVNEVNGKAFGDRVLVAVADGIRKLLNGRFGIGCRSHADLFYVLVEHREDPRSYSDLLMDALREAIGAQANVRLRVGVFQRLDADARTVEWYSDAAKSACASLRNNYQKSVMVYDEEMHRKELIHERLIADMDEAIREKQFKVFYQPKYNIRGEKPTLYSAEALVRWVHPDLGFISPGVFIPLFEENGLIIKLDDYVWRETARQLGEWNRKYGVKLPISVNLSRMDFYDAHLKERFVQIVRENCISVEDIMLEVTESAYSQDMDQMIRTVGELREAGFQIEMDDFGSGYSSLNMLCVLPIDAMKIDMKFVQNIVNAGSGYRMVELVIEMARALNVPAIVEGVEDEDQYRLVKQAGCDVVQGYYFSRPVDAESFEKLLLQDRQKG